MNATARKVLQEKAVRNAARDACETRLAQVKADLAARGVAGRIADDLTEKAKSTFDESVTIAQDNPAVVGGTIFALVLWLVKSPLIAWTEDLFGPSERIDDDGDGD
jgi:hypothetical protein